MNTSNSKIHAQIQNPNCDWGFIGVFLNELKTELTWITTKNCTTWAYAMIQRVYLPTNQCPTSLVPQELKGSPQIHKKRERKNTRANQTKNFSRNKN
jgi:hypothetical protein